MIVLKGLYNFLLLFTEYSFRTSVNVIILFLINGYSCKMQQLNPAKKLRLIPILLKTTSDQLTMKMDSDNTKDYK